MMGSIAAARAPALALLALPLLILTFAGYMFVDLNGRAIEDVRFLLAANSAAVLRSLAAGAICALAVAFSGFWTAWLLARSSLAAFASCARIVTLLFPLALVSLLIGNGAFAFLYRHLGRWWLELFGNDERGVAALLACEVLAQALRYAPLLAWLLVVVAGDVPAARRRYAGQVALSGREWGRVELTRRWLPVVLVVLVFAFQDGANDFLVTQLALRPSPATASEMVSHALEREFMLLLSARSAPVAMGAVIASAATAALVLTLGFLIVALLVSFGLLRLGRLPTGRAGSTGLPDRRAAPVAALALPLLALTTTCLLAASLRPAWHGATLATLVPATIAAMASATFAWALAALCAYRLRDRPRESFRRTGRDFAFASMLALGVGFIPPLGLAVAVFGLAYALGADISATGLFWLIVAQVIRFTPVIFVLLVPAALAISDREISYLRAAGADFGSRFRLTFLSPAALIHASVALIAFNLVLNEGVIAAVFQGDIPSLADLLRRAVTGRSANYGVAGLLVSAQLAIFGGLLLLWGIGVRGRWREARNAH